MLSKDLSAIFSSRFSVVLSRYNLLLTSAIALCLIVFLSVYLYKANVELRAAHEKLTAFESQQLNSDKQASNIVGSNLIEGSKILYRQEQFYSAETHWLSDALGYHDKNLFSILDYGFQLNQNKVPIGISCTMDFEDPDNLVTYYNAKHIVSCSIGKCIGDRVSNTPEQRQCVKNIEQFISDLSLVTPIKIVVDSVSKEEVNFSDEYDFQKNDEGRWIVYEFTFFSPKEIQPLNHPEIYAEVYGKYVLLIRTYDKTEDAKIISLAEDIIDAVQFVNLASDSKIYY